MSDEIKALREENRQLSAALTDCNHGFGKIALKLAAVGHIIGFATDDEMGVIQTKTQQVMNALHNAKEEAIGLRQASAGHLSAAAQWARERDQLLLQIEVLEKEMRGG